MLLEIDNQEREVLAALVREELDEIGPEIHHTWTSGYREELKTRKEVLDRLMERLAAPEPAGQ